MKIADMNCKLYSLILLVSLSAGATSIEPSFAQSNIAPDNILGTEGSQVRLNVNNLDGIRSTLIEGGAQRGKNLFHSFEEFNVSEGRGAYFLVPNNAIQNVLTRVTGNNPSEINGILGTISNRNFDPTSANLFLINPNGMIFGRNASLDVDGSFVGTTANAVGFGEQGFFSATNPQAPPGLLTISPTAFLFNQINAQASIQNNSIADVGLENIVLPRTGKSFTSKGLRVGDGKSLLFVGGDINIDGGGLTARAGRVELGGLASAGTVGLNAEGNNLSLNFPDGVERSNVSLSNGAGVRVAAGDGGSIAVNTRNFEMTGESFLVAGIESGLGSEQSSAGNIDINASAINLNNISSINNYVGPEARGQGGDVNISARTFQVAGGAQVNTRTFGAGNGGKLTVDAEDILLFGANENGSFPSGFFTGAEENSAGNAGDLTVKTNTLLLLNGAQVEASTSGAGNGGKLTFDAQKIQLIGNSSFWSTASSTGDGGDLAIKTNTLELLGGSWIDAFTTGDGNGGNLSVEAEDIQIFGPFSRFLTFTKVTGDGDAGDLTIKTNNLLLRDRAIVGTSIVGAGKGGNINIEAEDIQLIESSNLSAFIGLSSTEKAGDLTIKTNNLYLKDGSSVRTNTNSQIGGGGNITIDAINVQLIGTNEDGSGSKLLSNSTSTAGDAGDLQITTKTLLLKDAAEINTTTLFGKGGDINVAGEDVQVIGSRLLSSTFFTGDAGDLNIKANTLLVKDGGSVSAATFGEGKGGNITVDANSILIKDGGSVSAATFVAGKGGNITLDAQDIQLIGGSKDGSSSGLFTKAETDSIGDAGDLEIKSNTLLVKDGANIDASTSGAGAGGKLTVNAQDIQVIGGDLLTSAFSTGDAGNLKIIANSLLVQDGGVVGASTFGAGKGGNVTVNASDIQLIGESKDASPSGLFTTAEADSMGDAGENLTITTNSLLVKDGARVSAATFGGGKGGNLTVDARNIQLVGESKDDSSSGLFTKAEVDSIGDAGNLEINTNTLLLRDKAKVDATTFGGGKGGDLTVKANDVQLIGGDLLTSAFSIGNAGNLEINTNTLLVKDGAEVSASTFGAGKGGNVTVNASDIQLIGESKNGKLGGLFTKAERFSTGNAGDLEINTNTLLVKDGANIDTSTSGAGGGGKLTIDAQDILLIGGDLLTSAFSTGDAGNLKIIANILLVKDGAEVSTATFGEGNGGNLTVNASDIQLIGKIEDDAFPTGLFTSALLSTGNAGNLEIIANILLVKDGAEVSAATFDAGKGGDLTIKTDTFQLQDNGKITTQSTGTSKAGNINIEVKNNFSPNNGQIIAQAEESSGGNITITAKNIFLRNNSDITTILSNSTGSGGDITLNAKGIIALEDSDIFAFAPFGTGGDITFNTRAFLSEPIYRPTAQASDRATLEALDGNNRVDVNASGGISTGNVSFVDISTLKNSLAELAQNPIDSEVLIASSCVVRSKEENGTFFITGGGGFPYHPGDAIPSVYSAVEVQPVNDRSNPKILRPWKIGDPIVEPTGVYRLANGRHILSRECGT